MREFDRGTRGWFLRKVVLGHRGGGGQEMESDNVLEPKVWGGGAFVTTPYAHPSCTRHASLPFSGSLSPWGLSHAGRGAGTFESGPSAKQCACGGGGGVAQVQTAQACRP